MAQIKITSSILGITYRSIALSNEVFECNRKQLLLKGFFQYSKSTAKKQFNLSPFWIFLVSTVYLYDILSLSPLYEYWYLICFLQYSLFSVSSDVIYILKSSFQHSQKILKPLYLSQKMSCQEKIHLKAFVIRAAVS